jgi:hypothetical protein
MNRLIKSLAIGLPFLTSCIIQYPQATKDDFAMIRNMLSSNSPYRAVFVDNGKLGILDRGDFVFVDNHKEVLIYSEFGVFDENGKRIDFCRNENWEFIKNISIQYFNNLKDFEQQRKEYKDRLEDKKQP